jgi:hypothetical protein
MSQTLTPIEMLALAQAIRLNGCNDDVALPPNSSASVSFTVDVSGEVVRGEGSNRAGTNRARTAGAMIMLLVVSGVTRQHSPAKLIEAWKTFGSLDKKAMESRVAALSTEDRDLFESCMGLFQSEIVDALPRIPAKGGVKFKGEVTKV